MTDTASEKPPSRMALQGWVSMGFVILGIIIAPVRMSILTRSLSKIDYGSFSLLSITAASLGFVGALGLRQFLVFILPDKSKVEQGAYLNSCILLTLTAGILIGLGFFIAGHTVPRLMTAFSSILIIIASLYILLYALSNLGMGYLLAVGEVIQYRLFNFLASTLWLCMAIPVFLLGGNNIETLAWLWLIGIILTLALIAITTFKQIGDGLHAAPRLRLMKDGLYYGFPLLPRYFALALFRLADRFVILGILGLEQVAYYTVAATLVFFSAETSNFLDFMLPHISKAWNENITHGRPGCTGEASKHFHMAMRISLLTTTPLTVGLLLWGGGIVELLAGDTFATAGVVFPVMAPVVPIIGLTGLIQFAITLNGKTLRVGNSILGASLLNVLLNIILVKRMGIPGAALATTLSYVTLLISTIAMSHLIPYLRPRQLRIERLIICGLFMAGSALLLRHFMEGFTLFELPIGGLTFLLVGHLTQLWTLDEIKAVIPKKS